MICCDQPPSLTVGKQVSDVDQKLLKVLMKNPDSRSADNIETLQAIFEKNPFFRGKTQF